MCCKSDDELKPRDLHTLIVGIVCRISGCANQYEASLDDQEDNGKEAKAGTGLAAPKKQRHTALRIFDRLRAEHIREALRGAIIGPWYTPALKLP